MDSIIHAVNDGYHKNKVVLLLFWAMMCFIKWKGNLSCGKNL